MTNPTIKDFSKSIQSEGMVTVEGSCSEESGKFAITIRDSQKRTINEWNINEEALKKVVFSLPNVDVVKESMAKMACEEQTTSEKVVHVDTIAHAKSPSLQEKGLKRQQVPGFTVAGPPMENRGKQKKKNSRHRGGRGKFSWDSSSSETTDEEIKAIKEVYEMQLIRREDDLHLQGVDVRLKNIPVVHPEFTKITNFYKQGSVSKEEKYSSTDERLFSTKGETVSFDQLCKPDKNSRFTGFVGNPGAGKTTFSKRLVKQKKLMCFLLKFMDLNYLQPLTLRELILDKQFPDLDANTCKLAFEWIKRNQEKCVFMFDGLDRAEWSFNENVPKEVYEAKMPIQDLISNLCRGHFLAKASLVFTSHPHNMKLIPEFQRPNRIYLLDDLPQGDMKSFFFAKTDRNPQQIWNHLYKITPKLVPLCYNPRMLNLVIKACIDNLDQLDKFTVTRMLATVLDELKHITNQHFDTTQFQLHIRELAFNAGKKGTVIVNIEEESAVSLTDNLEKFIILCCAMGVTMRLSNEKAKLCFSSPVYQEYYTAVHIKFALPIDEFRKFVHDELYTEPYSVVRRFLFELLFDTTPAVGDGIRQKQSVLKESAINKLQTFSTTVESAEALTLLELWCDIKKSNDEDLMWKAAELFPLSLCLQEIPLDANQVHCFCEVIKKVTKPLDRLSISHCNLDGYLFHLLADALNCLDSHSITELEILEHELQADWIDVLKITLKASSRLKVTVKSEGYQELSSHLNSCVV